MCTVAVLLSCLVCSSFSWRLQSSIDRFHSGGAKATLWANRQSLHTPNSNLASLLFAFAPRPPVKSHHWTTGHGADSQSNYCVAHAGQTYRRAFTTMNQDGSSDNDRDRIKTGDSVIAINDVPGYDIVKAQMYELQRVYFQGVRNGQIERVDVDSLEAVPPAGCEGYTKYLLLFSPRYHSESGPVILGYDEVQLVTIREEISNNWVLALPGLFWVVLCIMFYQYGVDTGRLSPICSTTGVNPLIGLRFLFCGVEAGG